MPSDEIRFTGNTGKYGCFSNFYGRTFTYRGLTFNNSEAAFQAEKDWDNVAQYQSAPPSMAKHLGRTCPFPSDWDSRKDKVMHDVVYAKFSTNEDLKKVLLESGNAELVEATTWHDRYWGVCICSKCSGAGKNQLGKTLMQVREELRKGE